MKPFDPVVSSYDTGYRESDRSSWNPKAWSRRVWLILVTVIILVVAVVVGIVLGLRASKNSGNSSYPDYSKLNYTLIDTCKWETTVVLWAVSGVRG